MAPAISSIAINECNPMVKPFMTTTGRRTTMCLAFGRDNSVVRVSQPG